MVNEQTLQLGLIGAQTVCPNLTNNSLTFNQYFFGIRLFNSNSVSSGSVVDTKLSLLEILCTWVSTGIAGNPKP